MLEDLVDLPSVLQINIIHIPFLVEADRWTWSSNENGLFSVRSVMSLVLSFPHVDPLLFLLKIGHAFGV